LSSICVLQLYRDSCPRNSRCGSYRSTTPASKEQRVPEKGSAQTAAYAEESGNTKEQSPQQRSSHTSQVSAQSSQPQTATSNDDVEIQRKIEIFTGGLVIVGVLQAGVMFLTWLVYRRQAGIMEQQRATMESQWTTMQGQLAHMRKQTDILDKSVTAAEKSAEAANRGVEIMISKERARLFIEVEPLSIPDSPSPLFSVKHRVRIHGSTDAIIIESGGCAAIGDSKDIPNIETFLCLPAVRDEIISPTSQEHSYTPVLASQGGISIGQSDLDDLTKGAKFVHFWGFIRYQDLFGSEYVRRFRKQWQPFPGIGGCWLDRGSEEENNETKAN
jgi:hypothetical protein